MVAHVSLHRNIKDTTTHRGVNGALSECTRTYDGTWLSTTHTRNQPNAEARTPILALPCHKPARDVVALRQKLVSNVKAVERVRVGQRKQTPNTDGLVANVNENIVTTVERAERRLHVGSLESSLDRQGSLVQSFSRQAISLLFRDESHRPLLPNQPRRDGQIFDATLDVLLREIQDGLDLLRSNVENTCSAAATKSIHSPCTQRIAPRVVGGCMS